MTQLPVARRDPGIGVQRLRRAENGNYTCSGRHAFRVATLKRDVST